MCNQSEILASSLRSDIVSGIFPPGSKLPSFSKLELRFNSSRGALQIALDLLKQQGFVITLQRKGMYVNPHPPHLRRYGLVLPYNPVNSSWDVHWGRLHEVATRVATDFQQKDPEGRTIVNFTGLLDPATAHKVIQEMSKQAENQQLAGLILFPGTFSFAHTPPFNNPALPKVFFFGNSEKEQTPRVYGNGLNMITRGIKSLINKGFSRIAVVHLAGTFAHLDASVFKSGGAKFISKWVQPVSRRHPEAVIKILQLLLDGPADKRPDGLIIADDNLVDYAIKGILEMGLQPGKDLGIISHCNWPWPVPSPIPMRRIGFHIGDLLRRSINIIDNIRSGLPIHPMEEAVALFDEETEGTEKILPGEKGIPPEKELHRHKA